ncbi:MAG: aminotransferase class I/II-fold pyridoxal phosphate-dependent enzyme [Clostridiales bacterium]|nr:aminotransferase class I/II-fold pyridoxal phosphate-dependent enzyme [Clostridiales bacterium]
MTEKTGHIGKAIETVAAARADRYHTPGHKGELDARDLTELGTGGELFPADAIERAERDTAALYGVRKMLFLTNGASQGIKAALWCFRGKKVLYAPGAHRAFTEGCELAGIEAVPVLRAGERDASGLVYTCGCEKLPLPLTLADAERALCDHPNAAALFVTSPDYLGRVADRRIAELCRNKGVALIADAAHGAHFAFAPGLSAFAFDTVADFVTLSAHKTLGAYTQSALLAVNTPAYFDPVDGALRLLGTTSPNYGMLARLENSVSEAAGHAQEYKRLRAFGERVRQTANVLQNTDYTRLCVRPASGKAQEAFAALAKQGILCEAVIEDFVVCILTPYDGDGKLERLRRALCAL